MMARLFTEEVPGSGPGSVGSEGTKTPSGSTRKLSFKTRQASARGNFRATKVSLSPTSVAHIASKFNTIVIDDTAQGRALLRRLSSNQRKSSNSKETKSRPVKAGGEGVVRAAIEIFEHHDSEKTKNGKPTFKKPNDLRRKLLVVRKSSSKSSVKLDDLPKKQDYSSKDGAKENSIVNKEAVISKTSNVKEIRRKPSLKAKPVIKDSMSSSSENSLNQRIAKFNNSIIDKSTNHNEKTAPKQLVGKPNFNLNERIAQFNKSGNLKTHAFPETNKSSVDFKKSDVHIENKENKKESIKSILRNRTGEARLVETKNSRLKELSNSSSIENKYSLKGNTDYKQSINEDRFIVGKNKELKVFQCMPDIITSVEFKEENVYKTSSVSKDKSLSENISNKNNYDYQGSVNSPATSSDCVDLSLPYQDNTTNNSDSDRYISSNSSQQKNTTTDCQEQMKVNKTTSPCKDSSGAFKSSVKPFSESPKLEKKTRCVTPDPTETMQIENMKPNNSFLWKPLSSMCVMTEVPIYDDISNSQSSVSSKDHKKEIQEDKNNCDREDMDKITNIELDVARSFSQEMTEHIQKKFINEENFGGKTLTQFLENVNGQILQKNKSFLHGKNNDGTSATLQPSSVISKPCSVKTVKSPPPVGKKPVGTRLDESPPQLPEKSSKGLGNLNSFAPPVPPSHTKPQVEYTLSEELWLSKCKKILEIPPPLRRRTGESADPSTFQFKKFDTLDSKSQREKRFSVSQIELLRRMSEMNLTEKRNSLPPNSFSYTSFNKDEEEDHHYTPIQQAEKKDSDEDTTYEAIGDMDNNYAEIRELSDKEENDMEDNVYDEVVGVEEDHYEAINCCLVRGDSDSSCDRSNSLYGVARTAATGTVYQVTGGSETSDEWVDLDNSDDQQQNSVFILREKERSRTTGESWNMKVRRQWFRSAPDNDDGSEDSAPRSYDNVNDGDETPYCDDFDDSLSDSSFDHEPGHHHIPVVEEKKVERIVPITEGIYGLMKQAGQRMRKHWTLGKSFTRMRKNKSAESELSAANLGQRGWSFKSKDKPSTAQSTFYLHSNTLTRANSQQDTKPDPRRLSTSSMLTRPTSPPPPPPPRNSVDESGKRKSGLNSSNTSSGDSEGYVEGQRRLSRNGNSLWYIESSTDTASEHGSSQGSDLNLRFADEPLYQFYAANIAELTLSELTEGDEGDTDGYEEISPMDCLRPPSALDLIASTHHRSLWCEMPLVRNSGVLDTLTQTQKKLQEAKFEVMTSEASYFKSLTVLDKLFASCPLFSDENILAREERKVLFGNVSTVRKCSEKLLSALQACWQDCILLQGICEVVNDHIKANCEVYVKYCTSQISMDRTLKTLKQKNSNFSTVLAQLESDSECQSLTLYSFLMLPMQRITRLRLLFETMLSLLDPEDSDFPSCQQTLNSLNKCVMECNEGARSQERLEEMVRLSKQLEFPTEMAVPLLGNSSRWLVRSGQVTHVNMDAKQTFGRRLSRTGPKFTLFLFTDLFLFTKKKSEECYLVVDHCQRSLVETEEVTDFPGNNRCLLQVTLLENADSKTVEMTLSCDSETDRQRWLQVLRPRQPEAEGESLYEDWDCPQVKAVYSYQPSQPDELPLALGDVINVLRKSEGWFYGERTRDGEKGWFPGNYSREIASKHVRARNLKQRHRLLQLSADLIQQRKIKS